MIRTIGDVFDNLLIPSQNCCQVYSPYFSKNSHFVLLIFVTVRLYTSVVGSLSSEKASENSVIFSFVTRFFIMRNNDHSS